MATGGMTDNKDMEGRNQMSNSTEDLLSDPNAAYPAYRKHSSGDLHSRLKTRKLLGVGETDDGDVHRSKLSQILGHSEQLYVKLPRGLRIWQFLTAFMFSTMGIWALMFPTHLFSFALSDTADKQIVLPIRLYGAALISLSVVFWCTLRTNDKDVIRWSLLASAIYFCIQIIVTAYTLLELGTFLEKAPRILSHRFLFGIISIFYYKLLGGKTIKLRRSNSNKDLASSSEAKQQ